MDAIQPIAGTAAEQGTDSQVYINIDPHVAIAIAFLSIAVLIALFLALVSTIGKNKKHDNH